MVPRAVRHISPAAQSPSTTHVRKGYGPHPPPHSVAWNGSRMSRMIVPTDHCLGGFRVSVQFHGVASGVSEQNSSPSSHGNAADGGGTVGSARAFLFSFVHTRIVFSMCIGIP